jgi:PDZ domain/Aspartyl protease
VTVKYLVSTFLLTVAASPALPHAIDEASPVKVPFILTSSGHFIVSVKINDKGPYNLIFDTGAPTMLISNRIAKEAGVIDKKGGASLFSPLGGMASLKAKKLEIGPLKAENVSMMVLDHPTVKAFSDYYEKEHGPIEGIVGFPFFARYKMSVDYQAKELTMTPNGYKPGDVMESMMKMLLGGAEGKGKPKVAGPAGLWGIEVDKDARDEDAGVTITNVMPGAAADKAGLKTGDRLLTIDGRWTDSIADTYRAASYAKPGTAAPVGIKRDGKEMKISVTPASGL